MKVVLDIEANSLTPTKTWCIVSKDISNNHFHIFKQETLNDFVYFSKNVETFIAHNGVAYDVPSLNRLLGTSIKVSQVEDTLIMSRLFNPTRAGGHSLDNWGEFLRFRKGNFTDFSQYSEEMLTYCIQDVELTHKVYNYLKIEGSGFSKDSIRLEHSVQHILEEQKKHGFYLDQSRALEIRTQCLNIMKDIEFEVEQSFFPKPKAIRSVVPKYTKDGRMSVVGLKAIENPLETVRGDFTLIDYEKFNLSSPKQVVERMQEFGWKPTVFNKPSEIMKRKGIKGTPKVCEENIATLPDTAPTVAKDIGTYLMCKNRANLVQQWFDAVVNGDPHEFNRQAAGIDTRARAKTFIYAFLLGAGDAKLGSIVGGTAKDGAELRARFMDRITGVKKLKEQNIKDAERGYIIGLDGRRLPIKSAHFALSSYLQGGEAVIMKAALVNWYNKVKSLNLDAMPVANVHDEFQIECHKDIAELVGEIVVESIRKTTKTFNLNCPMDGEARYGLSWGKTH